MVAGMKVPAAAALSVPPLKLTSARAVAVPAPTVMARVVTVPPLRLRLPRPLMVPVRLNWILCPALSRTPPETVKAPP